MDTNRTSIRTLDILDLLTKRPHGLTMIEISKQLSIPPSSLESISSSLVYRNFLYRHSQTLRYHLGLKLLSLTSQFNQTNPLIQAAAPVIEEKIRSRCGETVTMSVMDGRDILFIYVNKGISNDLQVINTVGQRLPAYATGSGTVLLSFFSREQVNKLYSESQFERLTEKTKRTKEVLFKQMEDYRRLGYTYDEEESEAGIWAVCSCILGSQATPLAALSIVAPRIRVTPETKQLWTQILVESAEQINQNLG